MTSDQATIKLAGPSNYYEWLCMIEVTVPNDL